MEAFKTACQDNPKLAICTVAGTILVGRVMRYLTSINDGR